MADNELSALEPAVTGELETPSSGLNDFWGTLVDYVLIVDQRTFGGKQRWQRQMKVTIKADPTESKPDGYMQYTWFRLPTNPDNGEPLRNQDGTLRRPRKDDDWGIFETHIGEIDVPWEGRLSGLYGIHARWQYKEFPSKWRKNQDGKPVVVSGKFIVDWDHYDNRIRSERGLSAMTATHTPTVTAPTVQAAPQDNSVEEALAVLDGKSLIQYVGTIQQHHKSLVSYATADQVAVWEKAGLVIKDGTNTYHAVAVS